MRVCGMYVKGKQTRDRQRERKREKEEKKEIRKIEGEKARVVFPSHAKLHQVYENESYLRLLDMLVRSSTTFKRMRFFQKFAQHSLNFTHRTGCRH